MKAKDISTEKLKKLIQIRKRRSYAEWKRLSERLNAGILTVYDLLLLMHNTIDGRGGYGYNSTAVASFESLGQLAEDFNLRNIKVRLVEEGK